MGEGCKDVGLVGVSKEEISRVKLTEVNPHLVCVLCHGYFVDATTITECLHSFCRSCIFRHLETKSFCPICQVQVHARLQRSLKPDKTLQDIVYKLVPGLFHNEMERRRAFYKQHPYRDEHLEPERRGLGLDRLIYSPTDTISLSLEFYDTEREREEWSSITCPPPHQESPSSSTSNNNNKRYLQCPAIFKMAHLKKFLRQKYNLPRTANVEIIYKREFLPDSYSLMDVAYIYTWKRNGPMRFYYRIPDAIEKDLPFESKSLQEKQEKTKSSTKSTSEIPPPPSSSPKSDLERNKQVLSAAKLAVETGEKKPQTPTLKTVGENNPFTLSLESRKSKPLSATAMKTTVAVTKSATESCELEKVDVKNKTLSLQKSQENNSSEKSIGESKTGATLTTNSPSSNADSCKDNVKESLNKEENNAQKSADKDRASAVISPKIPKQDELPVEVLLSLSTCRVRKGINSADSVKDSVTVTENKPTPLTNLTQAPKVKHSSNARMSLNKIASELQQKAANNFIQKVSKENSVSPNKSINAAGKVSPNSKTPCTNKITNLPNNLNGRVNGNKRKSNVSLGHGRNFLNDMGVMDHRIQQLYKFPGSPGNGNGVVQVGQKTESRLASWLNNRFQSKPPGSPVHPGISSSPVPTLTNALSSQLTMSPKLNGNKPSESSGISNFNMSLQNSIKNSTQLNIPSQVGLLCKNNINSNSVGQSPGSPGKAPFGEKSDKNKISNFSNGLPAKKEQEMLKDALMKSSVLPPQKNKSNSPVPHKPTSKVEESSPAKKENNSSAASYVKDQGLVIPEVTSHCVTKEKPASHSVTKEKPANHSATKEKPASMFTPPSGIMNKSPMSIPAKEATPTNGDHSFKKSTVAVNGSDAVTKPCDRKEENKKLTDNKGDSSKLDEEVNRLKRKLEEMRKMSNAKGKELGGCQITHENPDPEEAKRRRDITPVVSIELMRGCKRPVPGLKAIQDIVDLGKRKTLDEKKELPEKKLKISAVKKDVSKKEETCALDLSRCGPPKPPTPPHPWFNPLLHQQFLPSPK